MKLRDMTEPTSLDGLTLAYEQGIESCSSEVLVQLIHDLKVLLQKRSFLLINEILRTADFSLLSPEAIVAILRVLSASKSELYEWKSSLLRAINVLNDRELETDQILRGLV